jgi:hypothetical protein
MLTPSSSSSGFGKTKDAVATMEQIEDKDKECDSLQKEVRRLTIKLQARCTYISLCVCVCVYMYICTCMCISLYTYLYVYVYDTCICVCLSA